jgi:hypothetical protein
MITEAFQVILKYVAPGQEDIVIQDVCSKLSFAFNDSEKKLETITEALNEAYQQQNDRINQLQILLLFCTLTHKGGVSVVHIADDIQKQSKAIYLLYI